MVQPYYRMERSLSSFAYKKKCYTFLYKPLLPHPGTTHLAPLINLSLGAYAMASTFPCPSPTTGQSHAHPLPILRHSLEEMSICSSQEPRGRPLGRLHHGSSLADITQCAGSAFGNQASGSYNRSWL